MQATGRTVARWEFVTERRACGLERRDREPAGQSGSEFSYCIHQPGALGPRRGSGAQRICADSSGNFKGGLTLIANR